MSGGHMRKEPGAGKQGPETRLVPIADLYPELEVILQRSEDLAGRPSTSDEQVREMARHLASIRILLADLLILTDDAGLSGENGAPIRQLAARFLAIEGKVKEIRNDRMVEIMHTAQPERRDRH